MQSEAVRITLKFIGDLKLSVTKKTATNITILSVGKTPISFMSF